MAEYIERTGLLCALVENNFPWMQFFDAYEIAKNVPVEDVAPRSSRAVDKPDGMRKRWRLLLCVQQKGL